jgi:hypothetical protein
VSSTHTHTLPNSAGTPNLNDWPEMANLPEYKEDFPEFPAGKPQHHKTDTIDLARY